MPSFADITVCAIHGNGGIARAIPALERTAAALPGSRKLLVTDVPIDYPAAEQKLLHQKFDYLGFQHFVVYGLAGFIDTEYALIVQDDGWALDGRNWRDEWFQYDYIGAATHAALIGDAFYRRYTWMGRDGSPLVVQNGGFSLRSRRLLEAPARYGITMTPQKGVELNLEDVQLCCFMRPALEKVGLRFAPLGEAKLFSFEHLYPAMHGDIDIKKIFGNHSRVRRLLGPNEIAIMATEEQIAQVPWEDRVLDLLRGYGYALRHTPPPPPPDTPPPRQ